MFLYTKKKYSEKEILKNDPIYIASKTNLTNEVKELYPKNYETMTKEVKAYTDK